MTGRIDGTDWAVRLDDEYANALALLAELHHVDMAEIVRRAIATLTFVSTTTSNLDLCLRDKWSGNLTRVRWTWGEAP